MGINVADWGTMLGQCWGDLGGLGGAGGGAGGFGSGGSSGAGGRKDHCENGRRVNEVYSFFQAGTAYSIRP